ncbi:uncharacterized protein LOC119632438 isoform X2 [Glossina fuscipes]|uniref:Uncharacterized protein LOC119632438 isoform X2 n=1 Tax=Glossina fuscipes TaxID=7396 RepID=A0A8U0WB46_9MUSC|nr:uncharacterized protein LOC119632438 isoform X2 [Glossina fuscipes]
MYLTRFQFIMACTVICSICTDTFNSLDNVGCISCGHIFHDLCIRNWMERSNLCPICRSYYSIIKKVYLNFDGNMDGEVKLKLKLQQAENKIKALLEKVDEIDKKYTELQKEYNLSESNFLSLHKQYTELDENNKRMNTWLAEVHDIPSQTCEKSVDFCQQAMQLYGQKASTERKDNTAFPFTFPATTVIYRNSRSGGDYDKQGDSSSINLFEISSNGIRPDTEKAVNKSVIDGPPAVMSNTNFFDNSSAVPSTSGINKMYPKKFSLFSTGTTRSSAQSLFTFSSSGSNSKSGGDHDKQEDSSCDIVFENNSKGIRLGTGKVVNKSPIDGLAAVMRNTNFFDNSSAVASTSGVNIMNPKKFSLFSTGTTRSSAQSLFTFSSSGSISKGDPNCDNLFEKNFRDISLGTEKAVNNSVVDGLSAVMPNTNFFDNGSPVASTSAVNISCTKSNINLSSTGTNENKTGSIFATSNLNQMNNITINSQKSPLGTLHTTPANNEKLSNISFAFPHFPPKCSTVVASNTTNSVFMNGKRASADCMTGASVTANTVIASISDSTVIASSTTDTGIEWPNNAFIFGSEENTENINENPRATFGSFPFFGPTGCTLTKPENLTDHFVKLKINSNKSKVPEQRPVRRVDRKPKKNPFHDLNTRCLKSGFSVTDTPLILQNQLRMESKKADAHGNRNCKDH